MNAISFDTKDCPLHVGDEVAWRGTRRGYADVILELDCCAIVKEVGADSIVVRRILTRRRGTKRWTLDPQPSLSIPWRGLDVVMKARTS